MGFYYYIGKKVLFLIIGRALWKINISRILVLASIAHRLDFFLRQFEIFIGLAEEYLYKVKELICYVYSSRNKHLSLIPRIILYY